MSKYNVQSIAGHFVISRGDVWIPGIYDSPDTAVNVAERFSDQDIETLFGPIFTVDGENRVVTMEDYERLKNEHTEDAATGETD